MTKILVVEDTKFFLSILTQKLNMAGFEVIGVQTLAAAREVLEAIGPDIFLGIFDLNLPDAADDATVELALAHNLPVVVYTGNYSEDLRDRVLSRKVIDYVIKEDPSSLDYVVNLVGRLWRNRDIKTLVVDDASTARKYTVDLLRQYQLQVMEASDGAEAIELIEREGDVKLVITDYHMPKMDGFQLIKTLRRTHPRDQLGIIGVSSSGSSTLSARFIKSGANDFLNKPFLREEFFCRVQMNVDVLEQVAELREAATIDYLTGVRNRRSFFEAAGPLFAAARRGQAKVTIGLIDLDHFKSVNDKHGHDVGDVVLAAVAVHLSGRVPGTDMLARFVGEEFCILALNVNENGGGVDHYFERLRQSMESTPIRTPSGDFNITVSIGVCDQIKGSLDEMLADADVQLYEAKRAGRNCVKIAPRVG